MRSPYRAARRLLGGFLILVLVMSMVFFLLYFAPGDYHERMFPFTPPEVGPDIAHYWGFNYPIYFQYVTYMERVFTFNLRPLPGKGGNSFDVIEILLPFTLLLFGAAVIISYFLGILLFKLKKFYSKGIFMFIPILAIPTFVMGILLKWLLVYEWDVFPPVSIDIIQMFPSSSWNLYHEGVQPALSQSELIKTIIPGMVLPLIILVIMGIARLFLVVQNATWEYVPESGRAVSRNCTFFLVDAPFNLVYMLSGELVIEYIFQWPGIGYILFETLKMSNYLLTSACIFALSFVLLFLVGVADWFKGYAGSDAVTEIDDPEANKRNKSDIRVIRNSEDRSDKDSEENLKSSILLIRFIRNRKGLIGLSMVLIALFLAVFAPYLVNHDPSGYADDAFIHHPPCREYILGTDILGRDVYSQVIWGFRSAFINSIPAALLICVIGIVMGGLSGKSDGLIHDGFAACITAGFLWPQIPLAALVIYFLESSQFQVALICGVASVLWPPAAQAISKKISMNRRKHLNLKFVPLLSHVILFYMVAGSASALSLGASIEFLGIGTPLAVSWGQMLSLAMVGRGSLAGWWTIIPPGMALSYMILSFFLILSALKEVETATIPLNHANL
ncbi:MAG: ABC transporter permease subunit [Theionarchaea archaeon]|nr:ABC transporter permease subunit [Theionarchaea archaeon]